MSSTVEWSARYRECHEDELWAILDAPVGEFVPEAIAAARAELERRGIEVPDISIGREAEEARQLWNEAERQRRRRAWLGGFLMYVGGLGFLGQIAGWSVLGTVPLPGIFGIIVVALGFYLIMRARADAEDAAR